MISDYVDFSLVLEKLLTSEAMVSDHMTTIPSPQVADFKASAFEKNTCSWIEFNSTEWISWIERAYEYMYARTLRKKSVRVIGSVRYVPICVKYF